MTKMLLVACTASMLIGFGFGLLVGPEEVDAQVSDSGVSVRWERVGRLGVLRAAIPGGWLLKNRNECGPDYTFIPDPGQRWH
jgi:hypothetical protein